MESSKFRGVAVASAVCLLVAGCGGGGGSSGSASFKAVGTLLAVTFPDPNDVNSEPEGSAPQNAPLVQPIVFTFSAAPDPTRINATVLPILDELSNLPVPGRYVIEGPEVTFVPDLPTRPVGTTSSGAVDDGGAGFELNRSYTVRCGPKTFAFVANVDAALRAQFPDPLDAKGLFLKFRTMPALTADSFRALEATRPQFLAADPVDGTTGVSPNFFSDPDALFPAPRPFQLLFDAPINPDSTVLNDTVFQLIDLDDRPLLFPNGLPLGIDVRLVENRVDRAVVEVTPTGILPFGHLLALQFDAEVKGLSETGAPAGGPQLATSFSIAADPGGALRDSIVETFDTNDREETDITQIGNGNLPADWNRDRSELLQAALEFDGTGEIGRFIPTAPATGTNTIVLDSISQTFPLPDGSTPDAPPGLIVKGGIFQFTDVDLPNGVVLKVAGSNPLIFKCTGTVRIAGDIVIAGEDGSGEFAYDSAITAIPGGPATAGGGRGGEAHPVTFFPANTINYLTLVSPTTAATGFGIDPADGVMKRIGGTGAQSGILDQKDSKGKYQTNQEFGGDCGEFRNSNGSCKVAGGGGGSLLRAGKGPVDNNGNALNGISNVLPDGTGKWIVRDDTTCLAGVGGAHPFAPDGTLSNDYYGKLGQLKRLIGGQGGGGGGTLCDNYYCGNWCKLDTDSANDNCCDNGDGLPALGRAPSVGDSRGGGGGGGGGAFLLQALGAITVEATGSVLANGGNGGGGEGIACSYYAGSGGGGAGGMIILQSASTISVLQNAILDVRRGTGALADNNNDYNTGCGSMSATAIGAGGHGGHGMIQLQVPLGTTATVANPGTTDTNGSIRPPASWIDPTNTLAPVEFTPVSIALSTWYDFGRVIARGGGLPALSFGGLDANGFVATDGAGNVLSPGSTDILCGYLGQVDPISKTYLQGEEPRSEFIPLNATVKVEFQGADAIVEGSKEVDPATITAWSPDVTVASGRQFVRWRVTFDTTADGSNLTPSTRRPVVERVEIHADF